METGCLQLERVTDIEDSLYASFMIRGSDTYRETKINSLAVEMCFKLILFILNLCKRRRTGKETLYTKNLLYSDFLQ
jgi:hypothetical protein